MAGKGGKRGLRGGEGGAGGGLVLSIASPAKPALTKMGVLTVFWEIEDNHTCLHPLFIARQKIKSPASIT